MRRISKVIILTIIVILLSSCGKKSYVVFDYNCNGQDYHKCELKNNKLNCSVETPVCGEYKFKGWFRANEYNNPIDLSSNFTKNEIIYARWEKGNGIIEPSSSQEPTSTIIPPGIIDIPSSSKEEPSSSETPVNPPKPEETYTISFNLNGGIGGQTTPISVKYNNDLPKINQTKPTKPGYTFMGWYDKTTGGTQYYNSSNSGVRKYDKKSNITLYAQWSTNAYTITFNANGGSGIPSSVKVEYNGTLPSINVKPTRSGYTFIGWYDNVSGGTQYYNASNSSLRKYDKTTNITLYARWKENELSIRYNGNGGTWNNPTNSAYAVDSSGTVINKSTRQIYEQKLKYGEKLESSGLIDYNGTWFNWKRQNYSINEGKEYIVNKTELNQAKVYSAIELSRYAGCDLSKTNCTITVKANWKKQEKLAIKSITVSDVVVTVSATGGSNKVAAYYFSSIQKTPDKNGYDWITVDKDTFKTVKFPGTYYLYIKDNKGNITGGNKVVVSDFYDTTMLHKGKTVFKGSYLSAYVKNHGYYDSTLDFTKEMASYNKKYGLRTRESVVVGAMFFIGKLQSWGITLPYGGGNKWIDKEQWGIPASWGSGLFLACDPFVIWTYKNAGLNIYAHRTKILRYCQYQDPKTNQYYKEYHAEAEGYSSAIRIYNFFVGILGSTNEIGDNIKPVQQGHPGDVLQNGRWSGHEMLLVDRYDDDNDGISDGYIVLQSRDIGLCYEKRPYDKVILYDMTKVFDNTANFADHLYWGDSYIIPQSDYPDYLK